MEYDLLKFFHILGAILMGGATPELQRARASEPTTNKCQVVGRIAPSAIVIPRLYPWGSEAVLDTSA